MPGVWALCLVALVVLVPGVALQRALVPDGDRLVRLAAAAPVGLGIVWTVATVLHVLGAPVAARVVLPVLLVLVVACAVVALRRTTTRAWGLDRFDVATLVVGPAVMVALVWLSTSGLSLAVPNDDGAIHSWMTARIASLETVSPDLVLSTDAWTVQPGAGFYPLGLHVVAALLHQVGVPVATALNAVWLLLVAVSLPAGMFALARTTFPRWRRVPAATAVVFGVMPLLPYNTLTWGGIAFAVGMSVVPAVVALCVTAATGRRAVAPAAVIGVALVGIAFAHTSEVVVTALVVLGLVVGDRRLRVSVRWSTAVRAALVSAAVLVVVALPWVAALRAGGAERAVLDLSDKTGVDTVVIWVLYLLGPLLPAMGIVAVVGLVVATKARAFGGWWLVIAMSTALVVLTYLDPPVVRVLTVPWYGLPDRVSATMLYPSGLAVAVGCWWIARTVARRLGAAPGLSEATGTVVTRVLLSVLVGGVVLGGMVVDCWQKAQTGYVGDDGPGTGASLTTPTAAAGFAELASLVPSGGRVLNEFSDGSGWMYADAGVAPLFAAKPDDVGGDRLYLLDHAAQVTTDARAADVLRRWDVAYAYVRDRRFPQYQESDVPPRLRVDALVAGGWIVVWQRDDVTLLRAPAVT